MSRVRHADEVKDSVDVEIVLGDTGRIVTDEVVINAARAGVLNHGASKVKVIATKIDVGFSQLFHKFSDHIDSGAFR